MKWYFYKNIYINIIYIDSIELCEENEKIFIKLSNGDKTYYVVCLTEEERKYEMKRLHQLMFSE